MKTQYKLVLILLVFMLTSCQKEFLEDKPDRSRLVPTTVSDFQAICESESWFVSPALQEVSADDFTISDAGLFAISDLIVNAYRWSPDVFAGEALVQDWSVPHSQIFYANIILEGLDDITNAERNSPSYNSVKGFALFQRAFAFYNLAQLFIVPFDPSGSNDKPGIPLRLVSDVNARYPRGTVKQTYDQVLKDLQSALLLAPDEVSYRNRVSKAAVLALLARVYLSMGDYGNAELYADRVLKINHQLIDYAAIKGNAIDRLMPPALRNTNVEVIFYKGSLNYPFPGGNSALTSVVAPLYNSYQEDDLRKVLFFRNRGNGVFSFRGNYGGISNITMFTGLATDELYLIRAECAARRGEAKMALNDLNTLLATRFNAGKFVPYTGTDPVEVLRIVLMERRKELICRGLRWTDLRRLNLDSRFTTELKRTVAGVEYKLLPNSNRYTFPIPDDEILQGGLVQNP